MSDQGEGRPRRALPPDDEPDIPGLEAADGPDATPADDEAGRQRLWEPTGPAAPAPASDATPIPPPAVLPASHPAPPAAGRRFSAVERPEGGDPPLPRRSAVSPSTAGPDAGDPHTSAGHPIGPRRVSAPSPVAPDPAPRRRLWPALAGGAVVVGAAVVAGSLWLGPGGPLATPTPTIDAVATYLLQDTDLVGLEEGAIWTTATTATTVEGGTPQPKCVLASADTTPAAVSTLVRTYEPSLGDTAGLLHQVDRYASDAEAAAAYEARLEQLAACERNTALLTATLGVTGLSDAASAASFTLQDTEEEFHSIVVSRTGLFVNVLDATRPDAVPDAAALASVLGVVSARQCLAGGACPSTVAVELQPPLETEPPGWLAPVDLPRVSPGAGTWRGTDMPELLLAGSRCENVDLTALPGATEAFQRTYLLSDDPRVPVGFGVDEAIYTFASPEEAAATAGTIAGSVDGCAGRTNTAQVAKLGDLTGAGSGAAWTVTQATDETTTTRFRVSVQAVGPHVVYLMANPSADVDFTDDAWLGVSARAAERAAQLG